MNRREFLSTAGSIGVAGAAQGAIGVLAQTVQRPTTAAPSQKLDIHTHYYTQGFFQKIREAGGQFSFATDPTGRSIITYNGARFFGVTPPMTDVSKRIEDMDRVGIDVEVISLALEGGVGSDADDQEQIAARSSLTAGLSFSTLRTRTPLSTARL